MSKKIKIIISAGLGIMGITALSSIPVGPAPLTVNEWQLLSFIYNYEIQQVGGLELENFTTENSFRQINDKIRLRIPQEGIVIDEVKLTQDEYRNLRDNLLKKTETMSLIEKILK